MRKLLLPLFGMATIVMLLVSVIMTSNAQADGPRDCNGGSIDARHRFDCRTPEATPDRDVNHVQIPSVLWVNPCTAQELAAPLGVGNPFAIVNSQLYFNQVGFKREVILQLEPQ